MTRTCDDHAEAIRAITRDGIIRRAMEPGGVDMWARIDRRIPGAEHGWVIVPQAFPSGYEPGAKPLTDDTIAEAIRRLEGGWTLDDLRCTAEFIDQVDAVLGEGNIFDYPPAVAAQIVQIGLFGSVRYR